MTPQDRILKYYQEKPFHLDMGEHSFTSSAKNDCGDMIFIDLSDGIRWGGSGCAQSIAAAGMMCEHLQGENLDNFTEEDMLNLFELKDCRRDCVLVAWRALQNALETVL